MKRTTIVALLSLLLLMVAPAPVHACSGLLCNFLGFTDRAEINAQKQAELARIEQAKETEVARIEQEAAARVAEAQAQLQREIEQGKLSQAQAAAQTEMFNAVIAANTDKAIRQIELEYQQAAQVIASQTDVAMAGLAEAGKTSRLRVGLEGLSGIVALIVVGAVIAFYVHRQTKANNRPQFILLGGPPRPGLRAPYVAHLPENVDTQHEIVQWSEQ